MRILSLLDVREGWMFEVEHFLGIMNKKQTTSLDGTATVYGLASTGFLRLCCGMSCPYQPRGGVCVLENWSRTRSTRRRGALVSMNARTRGIWVPDLVRTAAEYARIHRHKFLARRAVAQAGVVHRLRLYVQVLTGNNHRELLISDTTLPPVGLRRKAGNDSTITQSHDERCIPVPCGVFGTHTRLRRPLS